MKVIEAYSVEKPFIPSYGDRLRETNLANVTADWCTADKTNGQLLAKGFW